MDMVAKPLYFNWGTKAGIVLYPSWECDNKLPTSALTSQVDMIDRDNGPSCGNGPVFIAHHYEDKVPESPYSDGYHVFTKRATGGAWVYKDPVISASNQPFFETKPTNLAFEYVGWYIHNGTLYEFNLEGWPGGKYTGKYNFSGLYAVLVTRFPNWSVSHTVQRTSSSADVGTRLGGKWGISKYDQMWYSALYEGSLDVIYDRLCEICRMADNYSWSDSRASNIGVMGFTDPHPDPHDLGKFVFPKSQYYYWQTRVNEMPGSVSNGINTAFFADAYYKAIDKLPKLKQNLLANILDIVGALKSFKNGYKPIFSAKEFASESWLAYRYAYSTTISDLEEATNYIGRLYYLLDTEATVVRSYGTHYDGGAVYRCAVECDFSALMSASLFEKLDKQYNFRLSITNIWDMIPYSFVVDWFLGIGDILEEIDQWLDSASIPVTNIWYSYDEHYITPTGNESVYFRWNGKAPSLPYFTSLYSHASASSVTIFKRGLDALALLF